MSHRATDLMKASQTAPEAGWFLLRLAGRVGRARFWGGLLLTLLSGALGLAALWVLAQLLAVLANGSRVDVALFGILAGLYAARALCLYSADRLVARVAAAVKVELRYRLFQKFCVLGPVRLAAFETGALATLMVEKVDTLDGYVQRYVPAVLRSALWPLVMVIGLAFLAPLLAVLLLLAGLLVPVAMAVVGVFAGLASRAQMVALTRMGGLFHDRLQNLMLLRVLGAAAHEYDRLQEAAALFRAKTMRVLRIAFLSSASLEILAGGTMALAAVYLAADQLGALPAYMHPPQLSLAVAFFIFLAVPEFFAPLRALAAAYHDRAAALVAAGDILAMLEARTQGSLVVTKELPSVAAPALEFAGVSFAYEGREAVLKGANLRIDGGSFVAVAGPSGAGKSTLLSLLLGFIRPGGGQILVAGVALDAIAERQRATLFSMVGQRGVLFHGTLLDNIRLGRADASEAEVWAAAEAAQLGDFLRELPDGLQTVVGERGFGLSGGQSQRVALARAFLSQAPVLLLDEPTAGLDAETAADVLVVVRRLAAGRTVVMVSHDPAALAVATRVVRLENGQIAEVSP